MNIKKLVLFVLGLGFGLNSIAQTDVRITIDHSFNGSSASADQVYIIQESAFEYDRIQYYLSGFTIIHDGGQVTTIDDLVILVDSDHGNTYELGSLPVSNIENITFSVGVPEHLNHLDPSTYELNHPLAHQNPSMHWGWTYRQEGIWGGGSRPLSVRQGVEGRLSRSGSTACPRWRTADRSPWHRRPA